MTLYNVNLYREVHLIFESIEADTPEAAAAIACGKSSAAADDICGDCGGEIFRAEVDEAGDGLHEQPVTIDFEPKRLRNSAAAMLDGLKGIVAWADDSKYKIDCGDSERRIWLYNTLEKAHAVLAEATAERTPS
jgi:hypothetical protein